MPFKRSLAAAVALFASSAAFAAPPVDDGNTMIYLRPQELMNLYLPAGLPTGQIALVPMFELPQDTIISVEIPTLAKAILDQQKNPEAINRLYVDSKNVEEEIPKMSKKGWVCGVAIVDVPDWAPDDDDIEEHPLADRKDFCVSLTQLPNLQALEGNYDGARLAYERLVVERKTDHLFALATMILQAEEEEQQAIEDGKLWDIGGQGIISPIKGCSSGCLHVTSEFNPKRMHPTLKKVKPHRGIDLRAKTGTSIVSVYAGRVLDTPFQKKGAGKYVIVIHPAQKLTTRYFHLSAWKTKKGANVKQGDLIGLSGMSGGISSGPHLHFETIVSGVHKNPRQFLKGLLGGVAWIIDPSLLEKHASTEMVAHSHDT